MSPANSEGREERRRAERRRGDLLARLDLVAIERRAPAPSTRRRLRGRAGSMACRVHAIISQDGLTRRDFFDAVFDLDGRALLRHGREGEGRGGINAMESFIFCKPARGCPDEPVRPSRSGFVRMAGRRRKTSALPGLAVVGGRYERSPALRCPVRRILRGQLSGEPGADASCLWLVSGRDCHFLRARVSLMLDKSCSDAG